MSQSRHYSTFVCPCGFEARREGQETIKKLETIARLHKKFCNVGGQDMNYNTGHYIPPHKKDSWRENECREIHNKFCENFKETNWDEDGKDELNSAIDASGNALY